MENIYNNLQEFYKYRNYEVIDKTNFNEFNKILKSDEFAIQFVNINNKDESMNTLMGCIIICEYDFLFKVSEFKKLLTILNKKLKTNKLFNFHKVIFISENGFGNAILKSFNDIILEFYNNEGKSLILNDKVENLNFNYFRAIIPLGQYCSKHTILTKEESSNLLKTMRISKSNLPIILFSDPQVVWIGGSRGDIIHIDRISESTGKSDYYRLVI